MDVHGHLIGCFVCVFDTSRPDVAGVVPENVKFSEGVCGGTHHGFDLGHAGHVNLDKDRLAARIADFIGNARTVFDVDVGDRDLCTLGCKGLGCRLAKARAGTSDQRHFSVKQSHILSPSRQAFLPY